MRPLTFVELSGPSDIDECPFNTLINFQDRLRTRTD
jgi:hypothetical protein